MATLSDFLSNMGDGLSVTFDKESDELLLEISKAFVDEEEASYYVNNNCLPSKKHGVGKQLRIDPYDSDFDQDEGEVVMDGQEVNDHEPDNLLIEQPQRKHGIGKILRVVREAYEKAEKDGENKINGQKVNDLEVDNLLIEQPQRKHGIGKVLKVVREAYERSEQDDKNKINGQKDVKPSIDREQDLKANLEATKSKLRENYHKTLPTRHTKVLNIKDLPDLKRSSACPKKPVPNQRETKSVRAHKRKLVEEARRIYKKIKTECRNRTLAI